MNGKDAGNLIARLRKEAGYTQKSLAEALFVTDKAVSKWERGICQPDSALLTKLSMLLDADIEYLISGNRPYGEHKWVGEIRVDDVEGEIAGKPMIHYLISYFMLVGITDIYIKTTKTEYIKSLRLEQYGLNISFFQPNSEKAMVVYDKALIFGLSLTRSFQNFLNSENSIRLELQGREVPILFSHHPSFPMKWHKEKCELKLLGRGIVMFPLNTEEERDDASKFVEVYEKYHPKKIADLSEIAQVRGLIPQWQ